jgi:hypothetical protein
MTVRKVPIAKPLNSEWFREGVTEIVCKVKSDYDSM